MIDLYYWPTPNGQKISIMLEEVGLPYRVRPVNILRGEQFAPDFLAISPNNKIPALTDEDGPEGGPVSLFESGVILQYLAEKTGRFLPAGGTPRLVTLQWLTFQLANVGPMFGQCGHFLGYAPEPVPYAIARYKNETLRLYGVMDRRLATVPYLAGADYSIADIATYPWVAVRWLHQIDIDQFPNVRAWAERVAARPGVVRGMALMEADMKIGNPDEETREAFFGRTQHAQSLTPKEAGS